MSAPAEPSIMSGANDADTPAPIAANDARLQQPNDAVAMEQIPHSSSTQEQPNTPAVAAGAAAAAGDDNVAVAVVAGHVANASDEAPPPAKTSPLDADHQPDGLNDTTPTPPKSKSKDDAPVPPTKERSDSVLAIGPAQDSIGEVAPSAADSGPVCSITLLLTSGSRHPYRIDGKYLSRRNVTIPDMTDAGLPDPFSISIYTLKELILREWRSDWEAKPASPSSIRLIHFGKLLDDKEQLRKYQFGAESPNVVHMSIRPQDLDEEEPKSGSKSLPSGSGDGSRARSGGCCVVL